MRVDDGETEQPRGVENFDCIGGKDSRQIIILENSTLFSNISLIFCYTNFLTQ